MNYIKKRIIIIQINKYNSVHLKHLADVFIQSDLQKRKKKKERKKKKLYKNKSSGSWISESTVHFYGSHEQRQQISNHVHPTAAEQLSLR